MKKITYLLTLLACINLYAQKSAEEQINEIKKEGIKLYNSEMASWHGTDLFIAQYPTKDRIGGYFSYAENNNNICTFYSNDHNPKVIGTVTFNNDQFDLDKAIIDLTERNFKSNENEIYLLRKSAQKVIENDTVLFKHYNNTKYNLIPLIEKDINKVYVLTGPAISGVVIFGNDYLLTFNKKNELISKKSLHQNIIPIEFDDHEQEVESTMHSHLPETGDFLTPTDVCTLMLYGKYTSWKNHIVVSKNYLNMWMIHDNTYEIMTMEAVEKIANEADESEQEE
ncbi:hypothetical protein MG290_11510 [Flavobacterium sp. CBA20B-1]|uniref:hypothetical protein n=1 Tax=unclassified Flavobacterium TaxID=196869 RepID=UPI0022244BEF|nr:MULTISPECIES: hypothetical protein [unclassified Flavobacterium]WCM41570.1 hypothetical protein MG290_11510 [Flavobacterium sp. CBA20B-1]